MLGALLRNVGGRCGSVVRPSGGVVVVASRGSYDDFAASGGIRTLAIAARIAAYEGGEHCGDVQRNRFKGLLQKSNHPTVQEK